MSERKFNFVSPGIFINEIDNSQLTRVMGDIGPVVIGRTERGPGMRPVKIGSFSEYVEIFGNPIAGGDGGDVARNGNYTATTYAAYAVQAWLRNNDACTVVRLMGHQHASKDSTGKAGWDTDTNTNSATLADNAGAFGLFMIDSGSVETQGLTGSLAAIFYAKQGTNFLLSGTYLDNTTGAGAASYIKSNGAGKEFVLVVTSSDAPELERFRINFTDSSPNFIRKVLNTNPTLTNSNVTVSAAQKKFWLGESFEGHVNRYVTSSAAGSQLGFILPLNNGSTAYGADHKVGAIPSRSGWVFCQDLNAGANSASYLPTNMQKLFRFIALENGEWEQANLKISIENIRKSTAVGVDHGSFSVVVRMASDSDNAPRVVERYSDCNLNPNSPGYVGRKIGDTYSVWDETKRAYRYYGSYPNISKYIRMEMDATLDAGGGNAEHLPFGFYGAPRYLGFQVNVGAANTTGGSGSFYSFAGGASVTTYVTGAGGTILNDGQNQNDHGSGDVLFSGGSTTFDSQAATLVDAIDTTGVAEGDSFSITVPAAAGGEDGPVTHAVLFAADVNAINALSNTVNYGISFADAGTPTLAALRIVDAINGTSHAHVSYGTGDAGSVLAAGTLGITAAISDTGASYITLTMDDKGTAGNVANVLAAVNNFGGDKILESTFTGGTYGGQHRGAAGGGFLFPAPLLRVSSSDGAPPSLKNTYWGVTTSRSGSTAFDPSYKDIVRMLGGNLPSESTGDQGPGAGLETAYYFSLDDVRRIGTGSYAYTSGSRAAGTSFRGVTTADQIPTGAASGSYDMLLKEGLDRFTVDLHGGFDGLDITEKEPFNNRYLATRNSSSPREYYNYAFNSVKRAIDAIADPEVAEYNLMLAPGIHDAGLTSHMINVCEDRGDALAIIDLEGDYTPPTENTQSVENRKGTVADVVNNLEQRSLNSSYGCAYYPWVQIRDPQGGNFIWAPPSIAALGTFASSEKTAELWFAPAGFRRGGLTDGSAGLPVVNVADRLRSSDRDTLYAANINPIATFPAEGIVIFGQKTLQTTPSALDRINVRRLMIYVKKQISRMATQVLFDQNVRATWNRFLSLVKPFLRSVKARFGLDAYKVVLDETTTTPDLIDRNIMYAKIFLKPTRAIEFIALDFTITNSGASFAD